MIMRHRRSKNNVILLSLLSFVAALNASQAMVWCVGHDGHLAVEPVAHIHYSQTHDDDSHCCPCTDIPIPAGVCTARPAPAAPHTKLEAATVSVSLAASPATGPVWTMPSAAPGGPASCLLLRSIVLQV